MAANIQTDRNVYDRTWFNGYANDGSYYFGIGMAIYPHRGILDCAFSVVQPNKLQHCFYGSRRAPIERTDMSCGPFRIEILEPMKRVRVVLEDNESGITCDITFSARTASIEEAHQTLWQGSRDYPKSPLPWWGGHVVCICCRTGGTTSKCRLEGDGLCRSYCGFGRIHDC